MFTRLALDNWRNFRSVEMALGGRVFVVGPNAVGKSNLLDSIRFLFDVSKVGGGFRDAVASRGGVSSLRNLAARRYPDIGVAVDVRVNQVQWRYEIQFTQDNNRRPIIVSESLTKDGVTLVDRPNRDDETDPARLSQTYLEQVSVNKEFRALVDFFASVKYLHVIPHLIREPDRWRSDASDPFGSDLLEVIATTPERTRNARLRRIGDALRVAVPQLKELELHRDARGVPHLRAKYEHWRPQGAWQSEREFSDGTLRLLGLLWVVLDGRGPLLLEEPELSLHTEVVRQIPQILARAQARYGRQIIMSTHSSELLDDSGIGLDEVAILIPEDSGTTIHSAADYPEIVEMVDAGFTIADAVVPRTRPDNPQQLSLAFVK